MDKTNGDAAALALGKALSNAISEAVRPLDVKMDGLKADIENLESRLNERMKANTRVLNDKIQQLAQRVP